MSVRRSYVLRLKPLVKNLISSFAFAVLAMNMSIGQANAQPNESQWLSSLQKTEKQFGACDQRTAELQFTVGKYYHSQKQYEKSQVLFKKAMCTFEKNPGKNSDLLRYYSDELARADMEQGKTREAETLFKRALSIGRQLPAKEKTYALPNTLGGIAALYQSEGKFAEAETALKERIQLRHRFMNSNQVDPALVDLANLYTAWGKYDEARKLFDELFKISPMPVAVKEGFSTFMNKSNADCKPKQTSQSISGSQSISQ